ncbi:hypothetical protein KFU94_05135 [Chloroflexi bacterium TSY]|nr:hypothetical protein [Chloroflexi bacterium TSY]
MNEIDSEVIDALLALHDLPERTQFLSKHGQSIDPIALISAFKDKADPLILDAPEEAQQITQVAMEIASWYQDAEAEAYAVWAYANARYYQGYHEECLAFYRQALSYFESAEAHSQEQRIIIGRLYSNCASALTQMGAYHEAIELSEKARTVFPARGAEQYIASLELTCSWLYHQVDRFTNAIEAAQRSRHYKDMLSRSKFQVLRENSG